MALDGELVVKLGGKDLREASADVLVELSALSRLYLERRVEHFLLTDPPALIRRQVEYVVVGGSNLKEKNLTLEAWLQQSGAELVATTTA